MGGGERVSERASERARRYERLVRVFPRQPQERLVRHPQALRHTQGHANTEQRLRDFLTFRRHTKRERERRSEDATPSIPAHTHTHTLSLSRTHIRQVFPGRQFSSVYKTPPSSLSTPLPPPVFRQRPHSINLHSLLLSLSPPPSLIRPHG